MSVDFRRNVDDKIGMNPSRTIGSPHPQIKYTRQGDFDIFDSIKGMLDLNYVGFPWHGAVKSGVENLGGNKSFKNSEQENNFEVEKVGCKNSEIFNQKDSDLIHIDPNHTDLNQLVTENSKFLDQSIIHQIFMHQKIYWHHRYIWCIHLLWYPLSLYLPMIQHVTLNHNNMTRHQK